MGIRVLVGMAGGYPAVVIQKVFQRQALQGKGPVLREACQATKDMPHVDAIAPLSPGPKSNQFLPLHTKRPAYLHPSSLYFLMLPLLRAFANHLIACRVRNPPSAPLFSLCCYHPSLWTYTGKLKAPRLSPRDA